MSILYGQHKNKYTYSYLFYKDSSIVSEFSLHIYKHLSEKADLNVSNIVLVKIHYNNNEMKKMTNSNLSHYSYRKYKSENGRTWTSEYIRDGIRYHGGVSIPC